MHTKPSLVPQECAQELGRHGVSSGMDRELLEAEVRRIRTSGVTSASDVLEQLHKSAEWATVTISQVRRINTACKNLEPQLDAADKAAKRKAADQKRDRSGRARPAEEAAKKKRLEESQLAPRHLYDLEPTEFAGVVLRDAWYPRDSGAHSACAYLQPRPPASPGQPEPALVVVGLSHAFGSHSSWSAGMEFLAKQASDHQAKAVCLIVRSSTIQHCPIPPWMREDIGVVVQLKAPDLSIVQFTQSASDARVGETFDVEHSEIDLLPTALFAV